MLRRSFIFTAALAMAAICLSPCHAQDTLHQEADQLASLLQWRHGGVVAEIGAGEGQLSLAAAQRVGPAGRVYSNELDSERLAHLRDLAKTHTNLRVVQSSEASVNLPPACCDSIFMRLVYHHFTKPVPIDASLAQALKPGGRLAVIDEEPRPGSTIPEGVPASRIGHGIPQAVLIDELKRTGFAVESVHNDWPSDADHRLYCVIFRKALRSPY